MALVELNNVWKYYYSSSEVTQALRKVSLKLDMGEFVAITGESGSGKSTLLRIISGMDSFDEGNMSAYGNDTGHYDDDDWEHYRRRKIGFVFQDYSLIPHYTARDNIISALLILGMELGQAEKKSMEYLERVGLKEYATRRADKLSSGQKQRLSIARALAKGTDIIVADEPTGNLDSETGDTIVRLFKELSADHLVIVVTHNYSQFEPYITRHIQLHDGEIVTDVISDKDSGVVNKENSERTLSVTQEENDDSPDAARAGMRERFFTHGRGAVYMALKNIVTSPVRSIIFVCFFSLIAAVSVMFIGTIYINADDVFTKKYDNTAFYKKDSKRLCIKRKDGKEITKKDLKKIRNVKYVKSADMYDQVNDINYFIPQNTSAFIPDRNNPTGFMKSETMLTKKDLAYGEFSGDRKFGIIIYDKDGKDAIGRIKKIFMTYPNVWGSEEYYTSLFIVVGVLKEKTDQIYFSEGISSMFTRGMNGQSFTVNYAYDMFMDKYEGVTTFIPIVDKRLSGDDMQVSDRMSLKTNNSSLPTVKKMNFGGEKDFMEIKYLDKKGNPTGKMDKISASGISNRKGHKCSNLFLSMSQENFDKYCREDTKQAAVYIVSYAKTDAVLNRLDKIGYDGISTYRASTGEYDEEKVDERLRKIGISALVLLVMFASGIIVLRGLMRLNIKDYRILHQIGMKKNNLYKITIYQMACYCAVSLVLVFFGTGISSLFSNYSRDIILYFGFWGNICVVIYNILETALAALVFNSVGEIPHL